MTVCPSDLDFWIDRYDTGEELSSHAKLLPSATDRTSIVCETFLPRCPTAGARPVRHSYTTVNVLLSVDKMTPPNVSERIIFQRLFCAAVRFSPVLEHKNSVTTWRGDYLQH